MICLHHYYQDLPRYQYVQQYHDLQEGLQLMKQVYTTIVRIYIEDQDLPRYQYL